MIAIQKVDGRVRLVIGFDSDAETVVSLSNHDATTLAFFIQGCADAEKYSVFFERYQLGNVAAEEV